MTTTTVPSSRIVGDVTPTRLHLLARIDAIVDECLHARRPHFAGWQVQAVLAGTGVRRQHGVTVALRATPVPGLSLEQAGAFPWQHLGAIAGHICALMWEVTAVVPDVATSPPDVGHAPALNDGWSDRLTA